MSEIAKLWEWIVDSWKVLIEQQLHTETVSGPHSWLHEVIAETTQIIVAVVDIVTVVVILYGFMFAIYLFVKMHIDNIFGERHTAVDLSVIRVKLWSYLLLALELFIAADIILTIWDPSIEHILQLGAIVVIRIVISHFLQAEMNELKEDGVHH